MGERSNTDDIQSQVFGIRFDESVAEVNVVEFVVGCTG
jgi:hypothetical protein